MLNIGPPAIAGGPDLDPSAMPTLEPGLISGSVLPQLLAYEHPCKL